MNSLNILLFRREPLTCYSGMSWEATVQSEGKTFHGVHNTAEGAVESLISYLRREHGWGSEAVITQHAIYHLEGRL
jgi:hypothetical protein